MGVRKLKDEQNVSNKKSTYSSVFEENPLLQLEEEIAELEQEIRRRWQKLTRDQNYVIRKLNLECDLLTFSRLCNKFTNYRVVQRRKWFGVLRDASETLDIQSELQKKYQRDILIVETLSEAMTFNEENGGERYAISYDDFEHSCEMISMLEIFKKNVILNQISQARNYNIQSANEKAEKVSQQIQNVKDILNQKNKTISLRNIALELTEMGIPTPRPGGSWSATAVSRILNRFDKQETS